MGAPQCPNELPQTIDIEDIRPRLNNSFLELVCLFVTEEILYSITAVSDQVS